MKRILRFAIILLGLQLTLTQVSEVGAIGVGIIAATLAATFLVTKWVGALIGVPRKMAELIAAGTAICGASAVIATNTVTDAHDEDVAYAVACVTVFGSLSMFLYPLLPAVLHLGPHAYGLWTGASIHEIAQVVAAAFQDGREAGGNSGPSPSSAAFSCWPRWSSLSAWRQTAKAGGARPLTAASRSPCPGSSPALSPWFWSTVS